MLSTRTPSARGWLQGDRGRWAVSVASDGWERVSVEGELLPVRYEPHGWGWASAGRSNDRGPSAIGTRFRFRRGRLWLVGDFVYEPEPALRRYRGTGEVGLVVVDLDTGDPAPGECRLGQEPGRLGRQALARVLGVGPVADLKAPRPIRW